MDHSFPLSFLIVNILFHTHSFFLFESKFFVLFNKLLIKTKFHEQVIIRNFLTLILILKVLFPATLLLVLAHRHSNGSRSLLHVLSSIALVCLLVVLHLFGKCAGVYFDLLSFAYEIFQKGEVVETNQIK